MQGTLFLLFLLSPNEGEALQEMEMEGASLVLAASFPSAPLLSSGPLSFAGSLSRLREKAGSLFFFFLLNQTQNWDPVSLMQLTVFIQEKKKADGGLFLFRLFVFGCFFLLRHQYCRALSVCAIQEDMTAPMHPRRYISLSYQSASQVHTVRGTKGSEGNLFSA